MLTRTADMIPVPAIVFLCVFFLFHLMPVWIWIYRCVTASKRHKNIEYAFTDKRIIVRKGAVAVDFKSIDYKDVVAVNLRYGLIDKAAKVGDIYITSTGKATVLEDLENPASVEQLLQQIVSYPTKSRTSLSPTMQKSLTSSASTAAKRTCRVQALVLLAAPLSIKAHQIANNCVNTRPLQNHVLCVRWVLFRTGVSLFFIYLKHSLQAHY